MVLARLLRPSDFGLLAMSAVLTGAVLSTRIEEFAQRVGLRINRN